VIEAATHARVNPSGETLDSSRKSYAPCCSAADAHTSDTFPAGVLAAARAMATNRFVRDR
jgi:hypothetical protein